MRGEAYNRHAVQGWIAQLELSLHFQRLPDTRCESVAS